MRVLCAGMALFLATCLPVFAESGDNTKVAEYLKSLPQVAPPVLDETRVTALAALPLSCIDHPQESPEHPRDYLWIHDTKQRPVDDYDKNRGFYGCSDWHSAVNSTWVLITLMKQDPKLALSPVIRQRLMDHLGPSNIAGEVSFFSSAKGSEGKNFERPYGYAWLLKVYGELATWNDPDGKKLAANVEPLAKVLAEKYVAYLKALPYPIRVGQHPNSALTMGFVLDYTDSVVDPAVKAAVSEAAMRFFGKDKNCPTAYEPENGDFVTPCLAEATLMSRIMDQKQYLSWLNSFLPPVYSSDFQVYASDIDSSRIAGSGSTADADDKDGLLGSKAHLIGLAFQRAASLARIASALPKDDPRVAVFQRLAAINARQGFDKMGDAGYMGQHWLATYAVLYLQGAAIK
jgi:hypothetical protein